MQIRMNSYNPIRILYVDDYPFDRELVRDALEKEHGGFLVTEAASRSEFEAHFRRDAYDMVLTDFNISGFEGLQIIDRVHDKEPQLPVVLLTGTGSEEIAVEAMKRGADDYIVKTPFYIQRLPYLLHAVLEKRSLREAQRQAETALQASEERFRKLFEDGPLGMAFVDTAGRFLKANVMLCRMLDSTEPDLTSQSVADVVFSDDVEEVLTRMHPVFRGDAMSLKLENRYRKQNGAIFWGYTTVSCFLDQDARPCYNLLMIEDITMRKELEREVLEVSGKEQQRLGQDLHDGLGQMLAGIAYLARGLERQLAAQSRPEATQAAHLTDLINQAREQTRQLTHRLYPAELEANGLLPTLRSLAASLETVYPIRCEVIEEMTQSLSDPGVALHLYRIAQEAVHNAIQHGKAQHVTICLNSQTDAFILTVDDDGRGFVTASRSDHGMGLRIMRYRAGMIGATLDIQPLDPRGTRVVCVLPLLASLSNRGVSHDRTGGS